jgi:glycosyltransferase involved in cell wall biosynthesis
MAVYLVWQLRQEEKRGGKPVCHLHAHFAHDPALIALLAHRLTGISYSFTAHARDLFQLAAPALVERANQARAVVTCCTPNLEYLNQVLPQELHPKVRMIHHGVDLGSFRPGPAEEPRPDAPLILSVGRLIEKKGFANLLNVYLRLKRAGLPFRGEIYGEGPLRDELAAFIKKAGLEGQVILAGARKQQELVPLYQKATIFVLTPLVTEDGDRDGIPNSLVEAMACGLPVVSTCVAGIPELVIHDFNGLLFEPHDVEGIASGLSALLCDDNRRRRLGMAAYQTVAECFDLRAGACQMASLFTQI